MPILHANTRKLFLSLLMINNHHKTKIVKFRFFYYLVIAVFILNSCAPVFKYTSYEKIMVVDNGQTFIEKVNGERIYGTKVKFEKNTMPMHEAVLSKTGMITIDGDKYPISDIIAYQFKGAYCKRFEQLPDSKSDKYIYRYLPQIKRGKINLYWREQWKFDGTKEGTTITVYRVQRPGQV